MVIDGRQGCEDCVVLGSFSDLAVFGVGYSLDVGDQVAVFERGEDLGVWKARGFEPSRAGRSFLPKLDFERLVSLFDVLSGKFGDDKSLFPEI